MIKSVDETLVRRCVDEYAQELLSSNPDVEEIVVFGSFANGTYAPGSDVDIFVLLRRSDKAVRDRIPDLLPGSFPVGVDLFPYTKDELAQLEHSPLMGEFHKSRWRYQRSVTPDAR